MTDDRNASPSHTELAQARVKAALEIDDLDQDTSSSNQARTLQNRLLQLDIEESAYIAEAVDRAKRIAVARAESQGSA
ncbi:hypothetical protein [Streptomyces lunaelactis]|uniref:hypothetical protein n=1 Tax=Streptomyces lunaelactis TaxID=1535768 RepID=UPI00158458EA|nr:hypothetical protein [Streptomyces lunaelactis]NUK01779.1 hypothetical protein [Streptomyces lunaelactis]NUK14985.1 hypothetical protein [Streptomyces lunaelactis]